MSRTQQSDSQQQVRACEQCGCALLPKQKRFCSAVCRVASTRRLETRTCKQCGKDFTKRPSDMYGGDHTGAYCSVACARQSQIGVKIPSLTIEPEERICPVCGSAFLVGGKGRPPKSQICCSNECKFKSRYRHGRVCNEMTPEARAYLAGIVDGEGSIILSLRRGVVAMRVVIGNTHRGMIEWVKATTGVGEYWERLRSNPNHRTMYYWQCNGDGAESVLQQIRDSLIIKHDQANLALETQERLRDPSLKSDLSWQAEYRLRMKALNQSRQPEPKRGPDCADSA